jgi:hypothetical protein
MRSAENWRVAVLDGPKLSPSGLWSDSADFNRRRDRMRARRTIVLALVALAALPAAARADTVVALGDSAISGEAGRWAGNTNGASSRIDALGSSAYNDVPGAESIPGCHRSKSAEVHIGGDVTSVNLACSGARTYSRVSDGKFKPGIDFYSSGANQGQALALQTYAAAHPNEVKAVVVLIGANDYGFADIVQTCVTDWLTSPSWWKNYCQDDSGMTAMFSQANINAITLSVRNAFSNVKTAMKNAGYLPTQYKLLAQTYSAPLPTSSGFRYGETGFTRQTIGGCGVWNSDANWARNTVVNTLNTTVRNAVSVFGDVPILDMVNALNGRKLCENTVGLLEEKGVATWRDAGAADKSEWVHQIRTLTTLFPPYQLQEDAHPNYWGQLALRNCFRQAYNAGAPRGGSCTRERNGLDGTEPDMILNP